MRFEPQDVAVSDDVVAAGIDHVRLSYDYLDRGDIDGYASLLDTGAVLDHPGRAPVRGREAVRLACQDGFRTAGAHTVHIVHGGAGRVLAVGRFDGPAGSVEFADLFTISAHGLLLEQKCFYFLEPEHDV
jgi:hypothetical protein